jgi:hypothetical protein
VEGISFAYKGGIIVVEGFCVKYYLKAVYLVLQKSVTNCLKNCSKASVFVVTSTTVKPLILLIKEFPNSANMCTIQLKIAHTFICCWLIYGTEFIN